jgi:hypothetical protein
MNWKEVLKNYKPLAHNEEAKKVMGHGRPYGARPTPDGAGQFRSQKQREGNYMSSQGKPQTPQPTTNPDGTPMTQEQKNQRLKGRIKQMRDARAKGQTPPQEY